MRSHSKLAPKPARPQDSSSFTRLLRDESGFTAVEFAAVAIPFLAFVFAIVEVALVYFGTFALENAVEQAARQIRTGQAQADPDNGVPQMTKSEFVTEVCSRVSIFPNCESDLMVDVRSSPDFSSMSPPAALQPNGDVDSGGLSQWDIGQGSSVVLVSVYYKMGVIAAMPDLGIGLSNQTDGSRLLSAFASFRNEPFDS